MTPSEVYVYLDAHKQQMQYGAMSQDDVNELMEMRETQAPIVNGEVTQWL